MSKANRIEGVVRLNTPLHCASPDKSLAKESNETPTVAQRIVTPIGVETIPYFPGNDIRGRMRRKAAKLVMDHICETTGKKVSAQLYAGLCSGAISSQPDSGDLTVEEAIRAHGNVYMGLFGGGARLLHSRFLAGDMVPVLQGTMDMGWIPGRFGEEDGKRFTPTWNGRNGAEGPLKGYQLIQTMHIIRVDDTARVLRPDEMERFIENATEVVAAIQAENLASKNKRKESKEQAAAGSIKQTDITKKMDIGNMATFQSIIAGTPLYFRLDFMDDVTDAHVGLALLSLLDIVREQRLGGWCRAGLGRFDVNLTLTRHDESMPVFSAENASDDAQLAEAVEPFVMAARAGIQALTEESLMAFFKSRDAGKAGKGKKPDAEAA